MTKNSKRSYIMKSLVYIGSLVYTGSLIYNVLS